MSQKFSHSPIKKDTLVIISKGYVLDNFEERFARDKKVFKRLKRHITKELFNTVHPNQKKLVFGKIDVDTDKYVNETPFKDLDKIIVFSTYYGANLLEVSGYLEVTRKITNSEVTVKEFEDYDF